MNDIRAFPLRPGHENGAHTALRRQVFFDPLNVGFLPGKGDACPYIDAELHHLIPVINEIVPKISRGFAPFFVVRSAS